MGDTALVNVAAFLSRYPPFAGLSDDLIKRVAAEVKELRFAEGATILRRDDAPPRALLVIRSGVVELQIDNVVLAVLREGECLGQFSLLAREAPIATCVARQTTSCYVLPEATASEVMESAAGRSYLYGMMRWVFGAAGDRLLADHPEARLQPLDSLVRRTPITISPETPIADAATKMTEEHVSSLLVPMRGGWGIVTDRELRAVGYLAPGVTGRRTLTCSRLGQLAELAHLPRLRTRPSPRPFQRDVWLGLRVGSLVGSLDLDQVLNLEAARPQESNHVTVPDPKLDIFDGPARSSPLEPVHAEVVSMEPQVRRRIVVVRGIATHHKGGTGLEHETAATSQDS
jgi:CRP-like cAMP-binding protein